LSNRRPGDDRDDPSLARAASDDGDDDDPADRASDASDARRRTRRSTFSFSERKTSVASSR
jgi:hypothetical protein